MRILPIILLMFAISAYAPAQSYYKEEAKEYFVHHRYADALAVLKKSNRLMRNDQEAKFLMAVCHFQLNELDAAAAIFQALIKTEQEPYAECWLYLGKLSHHTHQFSKAAGYYKDYLRRVKGKHPSRQMVWDDIQRCATGLRLQYLRTEANAENLGPEVNTNGDEFAPLLSPNQSNRLYFSARRAGNLGGRRNEHGLPDERLGHYSSDMFSCSVSAGNGRWYDPQRMSFLLNSAQHDWLLGFNANGSVLYFFQGLTTKQGRVMADTFRRAEERSVSANVFTGLSPALGDEAPFFVNDSLIYFASRRPGGYGGLDLYRSTLRSGSWSAPENLGPGINSPYDETTPFLARDGITLYYSTNKPELSLGGLDVVKAVYNQWNDSWTLPENQGMPINSAGDDAYFRIAKDGFIAYFSSSRKDGYGQRDLYAAHFRNFLPEMEPPPLAYVPSYDQPTVMAPSISQPQQDLASNPSSPTEAPSAFTEGVALPQPEQPSVPSSSSQAVSSLVEPLYRSMSNSSLNATEKAQIKPLAGLMQQHQGLYLIITAYLPKAGIAGQRLFEGMRQAEAAGQYLLEQGIAPNHVFLRSSLAATDGQLSGQACKLDFAFYVPEDLEEVAKGLEQPESSATHVLQQGLVYKVQVASLSGAYQNDRLDPYEHPMAERQMDSPYYRYSLGAFSTFAEAKAYLAKLKQGPFSSGYVTVYINGRRADQMMARRHIIDYPDLRAFAE